MGEMLRAARNQAGLSLEAASSATRIPRHNLVALETDDLNSLPAEPFTRGLIRIYARALEVPVEPVLNAYAAALNARHHASVEPVLALRRRRGRVTIGVVGVTVIVAAAVLLAVLSGGLPTLTQSNGSTPAPTPAGSGLRAGAELELVAIQPTEISVVVDGRPAFDGEVTAGSRQTYSPTREIAVRAEAPDAIEVRIDDVSVGLLGPPGGSFQRTWRVESNG